MPYAEYQMQRPLRPPAGSVRTLQILQRTRRDRIADEGTATASELYPVGAISGAVTIAAGGDDSGETLKVETMSKSVKRGHFLRYDNRLWRVTGYVKQDGRMEITAVESSGERTRVRKC